MNDKKMFYKREDIKHKSLYNDIAEKELSEHASEVILRDIEQTPYSKTWNHDALPCGYSKRRTEKRWCRCLVNYTKPERENKTCGTCFLKSSYGKRIETEYILTYFKFNDRMM